MCPPAQDGVQPQPGGLSAEAPQHPSLSAVTSALPARLGQPLPPAARKLEAQSSRGNQGAWRVGGQGIFIDFS